MESTYFSILILVIEILGFSLLLTYQSYKFAKKDKIYFEERVKKLEKELRDTERELLNFKFKEFI